MKLLKFLTEETSTEDIIRKLKGCTQILKEYDLSNAVFFRGLEVRKPDFQEKQSRLKERRPMNSRIQVHEWLNSWFMEKFGWPARNGVFVTSSLKNSQTYGRPFVFFPENGYKYLFSTQVTDLYDFISGSMVRDGKVTDEAKKLLLKWLPTYGEFSLHAALGAKVEVMFKTDKYYALSTVIPDFPDIMQELNLLYPAKVIYEEISSKSWFNNEWSLTQEEFLKRIKMR
jgi:hypothetical protein